MKTKEHIDRQGKESINQRRSHGNSGRASEIQTSDVRLNQEDNICHELHKSGLYGRVTRRKFKSQYLNFAASHPGKRVEQGVLVKTSPQLNFWGFIQNPTSEGQVTMNTPLTQHLHSDTW
ncbi:hypothetical protein AMECASPLE_012255 [Ameca splendens]|uniref:Uncharacterized protein n=1 Tax=Ameca splendens TaxID=208324 RepID=A0ABV0XPZ2_9TELE